MDHVALNQAIELCVQRSLASSSPLCAMEDCLAELKRDGWSDGDIGMVSRTAARVLAQLYNADVDPLE